MLVVVVAVSGMTMLTVQVVDVVTVLDGLMATAGAVGMVMHLRGHVGIDLMFVVVAVMLVVRVPIVQVVDMALVLDRDMSAVVRVLMAMSVVNLVRLCSRHLVPLSSESIRTTDLRFLACDSKHN